MQKPEAISREKPKTDEDEHLSNAKIQFLYIQVIWHWSEDIFALCLLLCLESLASTSCAMSIIFTFV